jgi:sugar/nucleoside kinase (ribokinase family)
LQDLYLLAVNQEEARALRERVAPRGSGEQWVARFLLRDRRIAHLLVPRGRRGVRLHTLSADGRVRAASFAPTRVVRVSDSTGAGDRLLAALLARLPPAGAARRPGGPSGRALPAARVLPAAMREVEKALEEGSL